MKPLLAMDSIIVSISFMLYFLIGSAEGGTCWLAVSSNGRCQDYEKTQVSFEECCSQAHNNKGWTAEDNPESGTLFFWQALAGGAPQCQSCLKSCDKVQCSGDKKCKIRHGRPRCVCDPDCSAFISRHHGHVCGTDRRTYKNQCSMAKHNCRQTDNVEVDFFGQCQASCASVHCERGKFCVEDQHGLPHCIVCRDNCPTTTDENSAVCGTDGATYASLCEFQRSSCMSGSRSLAIAYPSPCHDSWTCSDLTCPHNKRCLHDAVSNRPLCVTCRHCRDVRDSPSICGTDGTTYNSYCEMKQLSCSRGIHVATSHSGPCQ